MKYLPLRIKLITLFATACFALSPFARAVDPPADGGYPNGNTAEGTDALLSLTDGDWNTAVGENALHDNTNGGANTAIGSNALFSNTTASANTVNGFWALYSNTTGEKNTAIGDFALVANTTGGSNTAMCESVEIRLKVVPHHALYQPKLRPEFVLMHITRSNPVHPES